jgi:hypothetical protein
MSLGDRYTAGCPRSVPSPSSRAESEALTLRWEAIDLKRKTLTGQAVYAKNKETRSIPMNAVLRSAFEQMYADSDAGRSQQRAGNQINSHCLYNSLQEC